MAGQAVAAEGNAPVAASENPSAIGGKNKGKKPGTLSVLMHYAGGHKWLTIIGCVLSALAMAANMVPYVCIWLVAHDLIAVAPDWGQATQIGVYGWAAFGFAAGGIVLYFMGLMCTHLAAFRTASNIRKQGMAHLMKTPLGYFDSHATGLLRRRVDGAAAETETLLAHNLADISGTIVMFVATVVTAFVLVGKLGPEGELVFQALERQVATEPLGVFPYEPFDLFQVGGAVCKFHAFSAVSFCSLR